MTDSRHDKSQDIPASAQLERARRGARRTAWVLAVIVVVVYVGFLMMGAMSK